MLDGIEADDMYDKNCSANKDELETEYINPLVFRRKLLIKKQF